MENPEVKQIPGGHQFHFSNKDVTFIIRQLRRDRSGNLVGEVDIYEGNTRKVSRIKQNFSNIVLPKNVKELGDLGIVNPHVPALLLNLREFVWGIYLAEDCVEEIWPTDDIPDPQYLIEPILPLNHSTIIFGDGGSGKSLLAALISIIAQLPYKDNTLGLITRDESSNVLYIDYEADKSESELRLSGLCRGINRTVGLKRLQGAQPVADCIEQLQGQVSKHGIKFLIIDSLAPATGGNINEAEPAIRLFNALRTLPEVTTLLVAHNAKDSLNNRAKSVYGSVFFTNLARSVWECKKSQSAGEDELVLSLKHIKSNRRLHLPLGFKFRFEDRAIYVDKQALGETDLSTELPLYLQVKQKLSGGPLTIEELAQMFTHTPKRMRELLRKYSSKHKNVSKRIFIQLPEDRWGVISDYGNLL